VRIRWGKRSAGGVVKRGHGGWSLGLCREGFDVMYLNPDTGDAASTARWNPLAAYRQVERTAAKQARARGER